MATLPQMMARQLIGRMAGGQPAPAGQTGAPSPAGMQLSQQLSELQGADPDSMTKSLNAIKGMLTVLWPRASMSMSEVARHIAKAHEAVDKAIQASAKAQNVSQAVSPIANNASIPNPNLQDFASGGGA